MNTKKSDAVKFMEKITGGPLTMARLILSHRLSEEETQATFSKKLGISVSHLSDIENRRRGISPERALKFAKILGVSEDLFLEVSIEDMLKQSGINYHVQVKKSESKPKHFKASSTRTARQSYQQSL